MCEAPGFRGAATPDTLTDSWAAGCVPLLLPPQPARRGVQSRMVIPQMRRWDRDLGALATEMAVVIRDVPAMVLDMHGKMASKTEGAQAAKCDIGQCRTETCVGRRAIRHCPRSAGNVCNILFKSVPAPAVADGRRPLPLQS